jgi:hypothetical protein
LQPASGKPSRGAHEAYLALERFLESSKRPILIEPGEDPFTLSRETLAITQRDAFLLLECWDEKRSLVRRVTGLRTEKPGRLELEIEQFGKRTGAISLIDLERSWPLVAARKGARLKYRERFRQSLHRQFPGWRIAELSSEADLHHSFSPAFPRAMIRRGTAAWAAIGAPEDAPACENALSFGLIWMDYLRSREKRLAIEGLILCLPAGCEHATCHRVRFLNPAAARYRIFVYEGAYEQEVNPSDYTNLETRLDAGGRKAVSARSILGPEALLEQRIRAGIESLDATLLKTPVYGQVPQFAGGDRGIIDLLAVDRDSRLAIIELKVGQEIHLPLQALDYWMRVKWHLDRGEFGPRGYFTGIELRREPPRLILAAPAFEFHPTNETLLGYFAPEIPVERIGLGLEWQKEIKVVFRSPGKAYTRSLWPSLPSGKSDKPSRA